MSSSPKTREPGNTPPRPVTLRDIAESVGVSYVTVSMALRDCGRVSKKLRADIKRVAAEMEYRPDPAARALVDHRRLKRASGVHAALAWINRWKDPDALRGYREFDLYWRGAAAAAEEAGYRLEEFRSGEELSHQRLERILTTRNIRGIVIPPHAFGCDFEGIDWSKFCVVRIGHSVPSPQVHIVSPDQVGNAVLAFRQMMNLGYRRIGYVEMDDQRAEPRTWTGGGFYLMQARQPREVRVPAFVMAREFWREQKRFESWLIRFKPDAILTEYRDIGEMLEKCGRKVPEDIGVATLSVLDGNFDAGIDQNAELIGRSASEVLVALIARNQVGLTPDQHTSCVKGKWVNGSSLPARAS